MKYIYYKLDTADGAELDGPYYAKSFPELERNSGLISDPFAQSERFIYDGKLAYHHFDFERAPFSLPDRIANNFLGIACLGFVVLYCPAECLKEKPKRVATI